MSLALWIYLASIGESISTVCIMIIVFGIIGWSISNFISYPLFDDDKKANWKPTTWPLWIIGAACIVGTVIPDRQTVYAMVAANTVQEVAANPRVQTVADESLQVVEKMMADYLNKDKDAK